ncbi:nuclear receptor subfamily 1 group I member 2 [Polyodon spathula]|uniref:nuclear receptor subfamily 1 group I member 2 n=1 Tax=Polyodon spathula TaxID=7913 RepID=UPI001B7F4AD5|nr:nuclear receptor subfamily 1 group I member 2 [Polyodon spathula]XP_041115285.1 nuclear receptor subfamily 1 group I member 2 [Polyodon spathula]
MSDQGSEGEAGFAPMMGKELEEEELEGRQSCDGGMVEDSDFDDDEEPKLCGVCGDNATGYHFNAMTCEGCKGFFRRAMKRNLQFSCPFQNLCIITKNNRRQCQACRLKKCLDIGMLKELIMSDKAVEQRRELIKKKKQRLKESPSTEEPKGLDTQQEAIIQELVEAQKKTFDISFSHFKQFRPINRNTDHQLQVNQTSPDQDASLQESQGASSRQWSDMEPHPSDSANKASSQIYSMLPHIADLSTYMIQQIINFAKILSSFRELSIEDQIALLKGATFEVCQIRFNMLFNTESGIWECGPILYNIDDAANAGFQPHLLDPLLKFHYMLRNLKLHETEYVLMQAISLFSPDRPGVVSHDAIDKCQECFALILKTYIDTRRSQPSKLLFPKIMACLTELRTMNDEYTKQVLKIQDIQPDVTPLMMEVFSNNP